ncbi:MAG: hypothetical protein E7526_07245 [Ruminococcaceae bacterium]|nr:hypothetical protein [Oscillospiraceae bacterium]
MNKKVKKAIYFLLAVTLTSALFSLAAFFVFGGETANTKGGASSVPYYEETPPDNVGVLFRFDNKTSVFFDLDFFDEKISVILFDTKIPAQTVLDYGYTVTYTFDADYIFLADFIDRFGGLEMKTEEQLQRYTGVQVTEMLENGTASRHEVIKALFSKISITGFSKNDLTFIIKNTDTLLNFPSGYPIITRLQKISRSVNFVN